MPKIRLNHDLRSLAESAWAQRLADRETRKWNAEAIHRSDLNHCVRKTYFHYAGEDKEWDAETLLNFMRGEVLHGLLMLGGEPEHEIIRDGIITHVDEKGFLRFGPVGGISPALMGGNRVRFADGTMGVIGIEKRENTNRTPRLDQLYIDVGAKDRASCPVKVGTMANHDRAFLAQGDRWVSKAMDDRIGCAILVELMFAINRRKLTLPHTVHFVFSVQEEVGTRGATTAAFSLKPEVGISVDVTATGDTPKSHAMAVSLGDGPAIKVKDGGMIAHPGLVRLMVQRAEEAEIPYQLEVLTHGSTDARAMQLTQSGVIAGCVSIPCRYVHSNSEMVDAQDAKNGVELLLAVLKGPLDL